MRVMLEVVKPQTLSSANIKRFTVFSHSTTKIPQHPHIYAYFILLVIQHHSDCAYAVVHHNIVI